MPCWSARRLMFAFDPRMPNPSLRLPISPPYISAALSMRCCSSKRVRRRSCEPHQSWREGCTTTNGSRLDQWAVAPAA